MTVKCAWASIDERGKASGGKAGDQTGKEVKIGNYYNFGQTMILRPKSKAAGEKIAKGAELIAKNSNVGYDQSNRLSLWNEAKKACWDLSRIKTKCETDCSAEIAVLCKYAGITIPKDCWTGNLEKALIDTGKFEKLKTVNDPEKLRKGDIVLNPARHVIVVISNGSKVKTAAKATAKGKVTAVHGLNIRKKPTTKAQIIKTVKKGTTLSCYGTKKAEGMTWWAVNSAKSQWASAKWIKKV